MLSPATHCKRGEAQQGSYSRAGTEEGTGPFHSPAPVMGPIVRGWTGVTPDRDTPNLRGHLQPMPPMATGLIQTIISENVVFLKPHDC